MPDLFFYNRDVYFLFARIHKSFASPFFPVDFRASFSLWFLGFLARMSRTWLFFLSVAFFLSVTFFPLESRCLFLLKPGTYFWFNPGTSFSFWSRVFPFTKAHLFLQKWAASFRLIHEVSDSIILFKVIFHKWHVHFLFGRIHKSFAFESRVFPLTNAHLFLQKRGVSVRLIHQVSNSIFFKVIDFAEVKLASFSTLLFF